MKAIVQDRYGSADVLRLEDIDTPVARGGDVLIRVGAASAFIGDWHIMTPACRRSSRARTTPAG